MCGCVLLLHGRCRSFYARLCNHSVLFYVGLLVYIELTNEPPACGAYAPTFPLNGWHFAAKLPRGSSRRPAGYPAHTGFPISVGSLGSLFGFPELGSEVLSLPPFVSSVLCLHRKEGLQRISRIWSNSSVECSQSAAIDCILNVLFAVSNGTCTLYFQSMLNTIKLCIICYEKKSSNYQNNI